MKNSKFAPGGHNTDPAPSMVNISKTYEKFKLTKMETKIDFTRSNCNLFN